MANSVAIVPVQTGLPEQEGVFLKIRPIIDNTEAVSSSSYYELITEDGQVIATGNVALTDVEYASCGLDFTAFEDLVLGKLGIVREP